MAFLNNVDYVGRTLTGRKHRNIIKRIPLKPCLGVSDLLQHHHPVLRVATELCRVHLGWNNGCLSCSWHIRFAAIGLGLGFAWAASD